MKALRGGRLRRDLPDGDGLGRSAGKAARGSSKETKQALDVLVVARPLEVGGREDTQEVPARMKS